MRTIYLSFHGHLPVRLKKFTFFGRDVSDQDGDKFKNDNLQGSDHFHFRGTSGLSVTYVKTDSNPYEAFINYRQV